MTDWQRRLPALTTLVPFEAAFRLRNFTRAAEELHFSQATISRRVGRLERELGVTLFERRRHDVVPTPAAEALAAAVRLAFGELVSAADTIRRNPEANTLTIYSDLSLATTLIAPIIGDFRRGHPDLDIRVLSSFEPIETTRDDFDVGLQYSRGAGTSLLVEPIADDRIFPVCSPDLAALLPDPVTAADLVTLPLLHVDYDEPAWSDWHEFLTSVGVEMPAAVDGMTFSSYQVCLDVAEQGEGLALGWERSVQPRLDAGRLVRLSDLTLPRPNAISAYRPSTGVPKSSVDDFLTMLENRLHGRG